MPNENSPRRRGGGPGSRQARHPRRTERRERALERSESFAQRSVEDQLALIAQRPGQSRREVLRLTGGEYDSAAAALTVLREG